MTAGEIYDAYDPELVIMRKRCNSLSDAFNHLGDEKLEERREILGKLLGSAGTNIYMLPTLHFDYGCNTYIGNEFSANFNLTILDCAPVHIGDYVLLGPNVTIATPVHPLLPDERMFRIDPDGRRRLLEYAKEIHIENHVWIASNVIINGGVTIGEGAVIGSGSVVTRDIPPMVVAAGNPCRVLRKITEADRLHLEK